MEEDDLRHPANLNLLTNELKSLKKRLYSCELKGMELREKAMRHFCTNPQSPIALLLSSAGVPGASQVSASSDVDYSAAFSMDTPQPLHNEYLLEQIASHLPMPELRNMRLVCRLWGKEFFRAIASRKPLLVSDDESDIAKAHALIRKRTAGGVHNNVHISTLILLESPLRTSPILSTLVFHFGDTISGLKVDDCYPSGQDLYELVGQLPCLESLCLKSTIRRVEDVQADGGELSRVSVLDTFLNAKPELRHPVLKKMYWEDLKAIKSIAKLPDAFPSLTALKLDKVWFQIAAIEVEEKSKKHWHSLKDLKMTFNPRGGAKPQHMESPMKTLADRIHFPALTKLCLINVNSCERHELVKLGKLLKSVRQTLEELELMVTLRLDSSVKTLRPVDIFPSEEGGFPRLQSLTCDATLLHSVKILQQSLCPSLVKVNFSPCNDFLYWWKVLNNYSVSESTINTNVKTASLGSMDAECLMKISTGLFPSLSILQIADDQVGDSALRAIFGGFKDLEKLKVCQGSSSRRKVCEVTDCGITGIFAEKLENYCAGDNVPDEVRSDCWIGRLQKLRHIDLGEMTKCDGMTDISVHLGLATLPYLQELVMPADTKVSSAALSSLKIRFLNHRWRGKKSFVDDNHLANAIGTRLADIPGLSNSVDSDAVARVLNLQF